MDPVWTPVGVSVQPLDPCRLFKGLSCDGIEVSSSSELEHDVNFWLSFGKWLIAGVRVQLVLPELKGMLMRNWCRRPRSRKLTLLH